jgi:hypothetical protein
MHVRRKPLSGKKKIEMPKVETLGIFLNKKLDMIKTANRHHFQLQVEGTDIRQLD